MNAILATPIPGLNSDSIFGAYKKNFEYLVSKRYKPKSTSWTIRQQRRYNCTSSLKNASYSSSNPAIIA